MRPSQRIRAVDGRSRLKLRSNEPLVLLGACPRNACDCDRPSVLDRSSDTGWSRSHVGDLGSALLRHRGPRQSQAVLAGAQAGGRGHFSGLLLVRRRRVLRVAERKAVRNRWLKIRHEPIQRPLWPHRLWCPLDPVPTVRAKWRRRRCPTGSFGSHRTESRHGCVSVDRRGAVEGDAAADLRCCADHEPWSVVDEGTDRLGRMTCRYR